MENGLAKHNELKVLQKANDEDWYWFPIMMGIATKAEMELADAGDVQLYNELALRKYKLLNGGGEDG